VKKLFVILLVLTFIFTVGVFAAGCGTMPAYFANVKITSTPKGAKVFINGAYKGDTPVTVPLAFGEYDLKLSKEGYKDKIMKLVVKSDVTEVHIALNKE